MVVGKNRSEKDFPQMQNVKLAAEVDDDMIRAIEHKNR
jgi:hypothetical protein